MAEWRRVYKETWGDKKIVRLSRDARLLFVALITLADDEGYVEGDSMTLRLAVFRADKDIDDDHVARLRDELVTASLLDRYETDTDVYLHLPKFVRLQHPRKDMARPSKIKEHIRNAKPCNLAVTDPLRTRYGPVTQSRVEESRVEKRRAVSPPPPKPEPETKPNSEPRHTPEQCAPLSDSAPPVDPNPTPPNSTQQRKKRAARSPTAAERVFLDGFKKAYGHEPTLSREHAIGLAGLVGRHGVDVVMEKITAWWGSPAGAWADKRGTRGIGAFLHSFDDVKLNAEYGDNDNDRTSESKRDSRSDLSRFGPVRERPQPDLSRFDRASRST